MKNKVLMLILLLSGVVFISTGAYLTGYTEQKVRLVNASGQWVNGTRIVHLGFIEEGEKIKLAFRTWAEDPIYRNILIILINNETGEIVPERRYGLPSWQTLYWNASQNGYLTWGEYYPPKSGMYQFVLDNKAYLMHEPLPIKLITFEATIIGPAYAPYLWYGISTLSVGMVMLVTAIIIRIRLKH
jgi:hypothetical protein